MGDDVDDDAAAVAHSCHANDDDDGDDAAAAAAAVDHDVSPYNNAADVAVADAAAAVAHVNDVQALKYSPFLFPSD